MINLDDYGVDVTCAAGARAHLRAVRPVDRSIRSQAAYVAVCRRLDGTLRRDGGWRIDGRLVAVGWNLCSPTAWVGGELDRFLAYWREAVKRPETIGSSHNDDPIAVMRAMRAGVPTSIVLALGARAVLGDGRLQRLPQRRMRRLALAARAARRTSVGGLAISVRALAALGRLDPEEQRVALQSLRAAEVRGPVRVRDLDWTAVRRFQAAAAADTSGRVRAAMAALERTPANPLRLGRRCEQLVDAAGGGANLHAFFAPAFPYLPLVFAIRVARGETPAQIAGGALTSREAHEWCAGGASEPPIAWLCRRHDLPELRSLSIARWAIARMAAAPSRDALTRPRLVRGPGGETLEIRYMDRIDEIMDEDLVRGSATGVDTAFTHAAERAGSAWLEKARQDHRVLSPLPRGWRLYPRCMRHLATPAQLAREGDEMQHCVGTYASAVEHGRSVILALDVRGERSTAELAPDGRVLQHRGASNTTPPAVCVRALQRLVRRVGGEYAS